MLLEPWPLSSSLKSAAQHIQISLTLTSSSVSLCHFKGHLWLHLGPFGKPRIISLLWIWLFKIVISLSHGQLNKKMKIKVKLKLLFKKKNHLISILSSICNLIIHWQVTWYIHSFHGFEHGHPCREGDILSILKSKLNYLWRSQGDLTLHYLLRISSFFRVLFAKPLLVNSLTHSINKQALSSYHKQSIV